MSKKRIELHLPNGRARDGKIKIDGVEQDRVCGISFDLDANRDEVPSVSVPELIVAGRFVIEARVKDPISGKVCRLVPIDEEATAAPVAGSASGTSTATTRRSDAR